jgi:hypothetical protein
MELNQELTTQLWDLLTKEEMELGHVYIEYDFDILTMVKIGDDMVGKVLKKSPFKDHIVGFNRGLNGIYLVLDEEGQSMWKEAEKRKAEWMKKYGCD